MLLALQRVAVEAEVDALHVQLYRSGAEGDTPQGRQSDTDDSWILNVMEDEPLRTTTSGSASSELWGLARRTHDRNFTLVL